MADNVADLTIDELKEIMSEVIDDKLNTKKKKRKPSKYNIFIGKCMKESDTDMKICSQRYQELKEKNQI